MKWPGKVICSKTEISRRIYNSVNIAVWKIATAMRKARDNECEFVGQGSFAYLNGCCLGSVTGVCKRLEGAAKWTL